jgi:hypothetical protein
MFDCSLRSRGSRFEAAAFLTHSQTKSVSARSFVQDSGARSWAQWNPSSSLAPDADARSSEYKHYPVRRADSSTGVTKR